MMQHWALRFPISPALLIVLLLAAGGLILWLEVRRKHRFRTLRLIAAAVLVLMLAAILLQPQYARDRSASILLLTPGFTTAVADSIVKANPAITLLRTPGAPPYKKAPVLSSWQALAANARDIQYITGYGLPQHALDILENPAYTFIPAHAPQGIIQLTIPATVAANRAATLHGIFSQPAKGTNLILKGPGGNEDSIRIGQQPRQPFTLTIHPKQAGNFLYTLLARDSTGTESKQSIPVTVQPQKPYNILFLQRFPTFETQYLKRFLAKEHALVLRYQLSRNAYRYEYANHATQNTDRLNGDVLKTFDLVILDSDVLHTLPAAELQAMQTAMTQGLGILILPNDVPKNINHLSALLPISFAAVTTDTVRITPPGSPRSIVLPAWPVRPAADARITPLIKSKGQTLAAYRTHGFGKAAFQLLQETYRLTLEGDSLGYAALWTPLLEETARTTTRNSEIHITRPFPYYPDEPIQADIIATTTTPEVHADSIPVPITEDLTIDDRYNTTIWAGTTGWHNISIPADSTHLPYYISPENEWTTLAAAQATHNTRSYTSKAGKAGETLTELVPISPLIFYILFIFAAALLWITPKL